MSEPQHKPRGIPVAMVGIGCRFPGGVTDTESFWRLLSEGREGITEIPRDRIDVQRYFDPKAATPGRMMSRRGGFLDRINEFDADFFGVSPREAERLDPQQRLLLETSWEALEDAGQDVRKLVGTKTGVFIGQWTSDFEARLFAEPEALDFYMTEGSGRYASSGRISYAFGLRGPSLTIDTACSSSLVAVHLAVQSIRSGESQAALVGGANIILQPQISIAYSQSRMMSEDGRCKFGDASGDGYVRSEGVAVVFLKALDRAVADDDRIYAVIRGSAINNDGHSSGSLGRPSQTGQEEVLRAAYWDAGLPAGRVQYIEAHGTGTRAGDPVELNALNNVVREALGHNHPIYVGSVKTNFGHTEAAAGLASLIKTALALRHGIIPPSLHYKIPNPAISWADMPFVIPRKLVEWPASDGPRIAGVTGFGIAGTNAHVVLEEAPIQTDPTNAAQIPSSPLPLPLSAKSPKALRALAARFADTLGSDAQLSLDDVCWTAATRRTPLEHRAVFVAADRAALIEMLRTYAEGGAAVAEGTVNAGETPKIGFVCPGQGAQWVGMARQLMAEEPEFLAALKRCDQAARPFIDWSIVDQLTLAPDSPQYRLERIDAIQPVLVAITIAYAALLRSLGIEPAAIVGHSMGEVAAACIADVISVEQTMCVICRRSALMQKISGQGAMALVELSTEEAAARLVGREDRLSVAVSNSPRSSVISGDPGAMQQLVSELERDDIFCRFVKVDVASHSPQTAPLADELVAELDGLVPDNASIPLWSTVLGRRAEGHEFDAVYWGRNLRETVRFTDAITGMLNDGVSAFVELGPHPILLHSITQMSQSGGHQVALTACGRREDGDHVALLTALGQLWVIGYPIDWSRTLPKAGRSVSLPHHPWQRERHWVATAELNLAPTNVRTVVAPIDEESRDWLFDLAWKASDLRNGDALTLAPNSCWLVVAEGEAGSAVAAALQSAGAAVTMSSLEYLEMAIAMHAREASSSLGIVVVAPDSADAPYLPVRVLQAVLKVKWPASPKLWLVTRGGQPLGLNGGARVSLDQAALWGAARVVGEEHPELWGGLVDFDPVGELRLDADQFVRHLMISDGEDQIALRGGRRYVLRLVPATRDSEPERIVWRPDAAYLITGGFGDIGLQIARTLAANGVRRLILMGRTPLPPREEWSAVAPESQLGRRIAAIRVLEAEGLSVHLAAVDVSDEVQLREFLDRYTREAWPPIRGVIHAAVSLENALAGKMDRGAFEKVVGTKLRAAQLFDQLLPDLDVFILFSSMGGFLAHPGIANYAAANVGLDALAHDRRARGLPGVSIAWGPWENTGLAAGSFGEHIAAEFTRQGIQTLAPERCTRLCTWLCKSAKPVVVVLAIDWKKFGNARAGREYTIFKDVLSSAQDQEEAQKRVSDRLAQATLAERRQILDAVVRMVVGKVLKVAPSRLDPCRVMGTMGLNSLMAMEMRNRLEAELQRPLSATLAWNFPTIDALVTHLAGAYLEGAEPVLGVGPTKPPDAELPSHIKEAMDLSDEQAVAALRNNESSTGVASTAYHND